MEWYKFNLQLFAEDDGATEEDSIHEEPTKVGLDENGDVRFIYDNQDELDDDDKGDETPAIKPPEKEQADKQDFYTPDEVKTADFEKLDPAKIPPDMLPWYKSMQAGFTRKTQELANQKRQIEEILEKVKQVPQQQPAPQVSPDQYFTQRHNFLKGQVAQMFRVNPDDLGDYMDGWTPAQKLAYDRLNNQLTQDEQRQENERQESLKKQTNLTSFTESIESEFRAADAAAYEYTINKLQSGEVMEKDKQAIIKALQTGDKDTVKKYFDVFRKEYHGEKEGVQEKKANPPKVEGAGNGGKPEPKGPPDYSELGKLKTMDEKIRWMRKYGIKP